MKQYLNTYILPESKKKKSDEHESDCDMNHSWYVRNSPPKHEKVNIWTGYLRKNGNYSNHSMTKIGLDTKKSPGDIRKLVVTRPQLVKHRLTLAWKTRKENNIWQRREKLNILIVIIISHCQHRYPWPSLATPP